LSPVKEKRFVLSFKRIREYGHGHKKNTIPGFSCAGLDHTSGKISDIFEIRRNAFAIPEKVLPD
jgi:hypothetical protein